MTAIPAKLYEAFEKIRLGKVEEGTRLFDRVDGFDVVKFIAFAELSYFRHDWKRGIQFSLDFLASDIDWDSRRYAVGDYKTVHLELILVATCQLECWKESRVSLEELKKISPPNLNERRYQTILSQIADPVNTTRRLKESKPKRRMEGTIDLEELERKATIAAPTGSLNRQSYRKQRFKVSFDGLVQRAYDKASTEDHITIYERLTDRLEEAETYQNAAKSYMALENEQGAKEAIRRYMRCWKFREPFQVAPIVLFTDPELWPIMSDRRFSESLLTIPHHRESCPGIALRFIPGHSFSVLFRVFRGKKTSHHYAMKTMKFSNALLNKKKTGTIPVIPDIKCISPKHGDLLLGRCPIEAAKLLKDAGAPVMSVVTENQDFGGSLELLRSISEATGLPILRKDFITKIDDLKISLDNGAAAVLLMCATQTEQSLFELYEAALGLGLETLVETHTFDEMQLARKLGATLVGINNRDITQLERDGGTVENTRNLAEFAPEHAVLISESGINTPEEARQAIHAGADAVLVGTALWQAVDMMAFYKQLCGG